MEKQQGVFLLKKNRGQYLKNDDMIVRDHLIRDSKTILLKKEATAAIDPACPELKTGLQARRAQFTGSGSTNTKRNSKLLLSKWLYCNP